MDALHEVEDELLEDDTGWSPYLSVEDAYKLDDVRDTLRQFELLLQQVVVHVQAGQQQP